MDVKSDDKADPLSPTSPLPTKAVVTSAVVTSAVVTSSPIQALQAAIANFDAKRADELISGGLDVGRTLLDRVSQRNALHELALCYVAYHPCERPPNLNIKFIELMTLFVRHGVHVNAGDARKQTALHLLASVRDCNDVMKVVLASNVNVNARDAGQQTALHKAAQHAGLADIVTLLDGGADPNLMDAAGHTPMHLATKKKSGADVIRLLAQCGGSVNQQEVRRNRCGSTPLHLAARAGHVLNVKALLRLGAATDRIDGAGKMALHVAAGHDFTGRVVACLLKSGAAVSARDAVYGETALHIAVARRMLDAAGQLLRARSDPNAVDEMRNTVLHVAATSCRELHVWTRLMRLGGQPDLRNRDGQTARSLAAKTKNAVALAVMAQFGDN